MRTASRTTVPSRTSGGSGTIAPGDRSWREDVPGGRVRASRRRWRLVRSGVLLAGVVGLALWLVRPGASPGPKKRPTSVHVVLPAETTVGTPGTLALPWAPTGQSAVDIPLLGYATQSGAEHSVPVASLTKIMTAYVVLEDHPISPGQQGPRIALTSADVADFGVDTVTDQANVALAPGEVLTEYQMLEGLLVHSANDLADALARWDAGSIPAFVAKMNATAATLGMHDTHYADASGFSSGSMSTASDLLRVAAAAMAIPTFAEIVAMPSVTLPVAGTVQTYTPLLGTAGVVGVKSGFTSAAGGGDVLAYRAAVGGHSFVVLAAVTSQEGPTVLARAGREALGIARAAVAGVRSATVAQRGSVVARLRSGSRRVAARTAAAATVLVVGDVAVRQTVRISVPKHRARGGALVGSATFKLGGEVVSVPVRLAAPLR